MYTRVHCEGRKLGPCSGLRSCSGSVCTRAASLEVRLIRLPSPPSLSHRRGNPIGARYWLLRLRASLRRKGGGAGRLGWLLSLTAASLLPLLCGSLGKAAAAAFIFHSFLSLLPSPPSSISITPSPSAFTTTSPHQTPSVSIAQVRSRVSFLVIVFI